jgi:polar amino acid transport system substrate-binding protein
MRRSRMAIAPAALLCLFGIVTVASAQERPMVLVFFNDYAPFSFVKDGKDSGILVEVLTEVLSKRMKLNVVVKMGPWARMQEMVKTGEADAFCTNPTAARKEYAVPSKVPAIVFPYKIYASKDSPKLAALKAVKGMEDLRKGAIAGSFTLGSFIGDGWTKSNLEDFNIKIDYSPNQASVIRKVAAARIDAFVNNAIVQRYSMKDLVESLNAQGNAQGATEVKNIVELDSVIDQAQFYLCVGKASPFLKYLDDFDKALAQAEKEGFIEKVKDKFK